MPPAWGQLRSRATYLLRPVRTTPTCTPLSDPTTAAPPTRFSAGNCDNCTRRVPEAWATAPLERATAPKPHSAAAAVRAWRRVSPLLSVAGESVMPRVCSLPGEIARRVPLGGTGMDRVRRPGFGVGAPAGLRWESSGPAVRLSSRKAPVAQRIEHLTTDQKVARSNRAGRAPTTRVDRESPAAAPIRRRSSCLTRSTSVT